MLKALQCLNADMARFHGELGLCMEHVADKYECLTPELQKPHSARCWMPWTIREMFGRMSQQRMMSRAQL